MTFYPTLGKWLCFWVFEFLFFSEGTEVKKQSMHCFYKYWTLQMRICRYLLNIWIVFLFQSTTVQRQVTILQRDGLFERIKFILPWNLSRIFGFHSNIKNLSLHSRKNMFRTNLLKKNPNLVILKYEIDNHKITNICILLVINGGNWEVDAREQSGILESSLFCYPILWPWASRLIFLGLNFLACKMK